MIEEERENVRKEWAIGKDYIDEIKNYLSKNIVTDKTEFLLHLCIKLIVAELILNEEDYSKYPKADFDDEYFTDFLIETMTETVPLLTDKKANEEYIEKIRKVLWGHIKNYQREMIVLFKKTKLSKNDSITVYREEELKLLRKCMTVVFMERVLRDREIRMSKND